MVLGRVHKRRGTLSADPPLCLCCMLYSTPSRPGAASDPGVSSRLEMADPLTVIGGLAAVAQLSTSAARLVRGFYRFAGGVKSVTAEVNRFASQVRSFSYIVKLAQVTLSRYCSENPDSRVVAYLSSHRVLPNINSDAEYTSMHIRAIHDRIQRTPTGFALVTAIVWWFCKSSIMELYPEMESIKTNLSLLMATTQLEAVLQRASSLELGNTRIQEEM